MNEIVDLTKFEAGTIFYHVIKVLIMYNVSRALLKSKYSQFITFAVFFTIVLGYTLFCLFLASIIPFEIYQFLELIIFLLVPLIIFGVCYFFCEGKISTKIISSVIATLSYPILGSLSNAFMTIFSPDTATYTYSYDIPLSILVSDSTINFFASFIFIALLKFVNAKRNSGHSFQTKYCLFYFFPVSHLILDLTFQILSNNASDKTFSANLSTTTSIIFVCLIVIDFALIFFIDHFENLEIQNVQNEITKTKNELDYSQIELLKEEKQNFRKIKHDYLNFLTVAQGLIEIDQKEKALSLLKDTTNELMNISNIPLCSNETINTALYIKQNQAKQMGIEINVNITENHPLKLSEYDVSRILFNLLDNAIEAVNEIETSEKNINLNIEINEDYLLISCSNLCSGKKTYHSPERGNGMKIIKDIVKKYKGEFDFNFSDFTDNLKKAETKIKLNP